MPRFITEEDHAVIAEVVRRVMHDEFGTWRQDDDRGPTKAPDIYVAKVPDGGIPALDSEADPPVPGTVECDIYRLVKSTSGAWTVERLGTLTKEVHNLSTSEISDGDPFIPIAKLKGRGWVRAGGGGGSTIREGYLTSDLTFATNTRSGAAAATATELVMGTVGSNPPLVDGETGVTIISRDTTLSLKSGTYIQWTNINGENRIVWAACYADVGPEE